MSGTPARLAGRAVELREAFDRSFAQPALLEPVGTECFLAVRVGGNPWALRVAEISGVFADKLVTPVPSAVPEFLGISSLRGAIVPVYDLAALLGFPAQGAIRWLVLAGSRERIALAFDAMETQFAVYPRDVMSDDGAQPHVRGSVLTDGVQRLIANLPSVMGDIEKRVEATRSARRDES